MTPSFDFERASRDRRLEAVPAKPRVTKLLLAVDRIAQQMIAAGSSSAYVDDGQQLVAEIALSRLASAMQCSLDTASRAVQDVQAAPEGTLPIDVEPQTGRPYLFVLHWLRVPGPAAGPPAMCGGSQPELRGVLRGVAGEVAGGRTSNSGGKQGGPQHPPQFPRVRESEIFNLRESVYRDRENTGGEFCGGSQPEFSPDCLATPIGFFAAEASGDLPWQRLTDEQLATLDPAMLGVLYVEAVRSGTLADSHDGQKRFLAACWHCAKSRTIAGRRALVLTGRVKRRNYRGLMDAAWSWAAGEMQITNLRGAGAYLNAAMRAYRRQCGDVFDPAEVN